MTISGFVKTVVYAVVSLAVTGISVWMAAPMYTSDEMVTAYLRSELLLFVVACGILGVGVYSFLAYTRRHREHQRDSWFWVALGGVLLVVAVVVICRFGGMSENHFDERSLVAVNLNLMLIGVLPLPFLVRTIIAALGVRESAVKRIVAWMLTAAAVVLFVIVVATGSLLHTVELPDTAETAQLETLQQL